jgi:hypothetical protein
MDITKLTSENAWLLLAPVFPGFVSIRSHPLFLPSNQKILGDQLIEALAFSMANIAACLPLAWIWIAARDLLATGHPSYGIGDWIAIAILVLFLPPWALDILRTEFVCHDCPENSGLFTRFQGHGTTCSRISAALTRSFFD